MPRLRSYPLWVRIPYTIFVLVLVPVYWREYGPGNVLWFSDIALFSVLLCLWTGWRLPYSMMAVGVLPLEMVWTADILTGGSLFGLAGYMFDGTQPLLPRALSSFHLFLPPILIWMLVRQGYDRRAIVWQTALAWIVLPASWFLTPPSENINWVHGIGPEASAILPPGLYLALFMVLLPLLVFVPMHAALKRLFGGTGSSAQSA
jgi:hypothetical protein